VSRTLTPERQKLKQDAIRLHQELGWSTRKIAVHLNLSQTTIMRFLNHNNSLKLNHNPSLNQVHITDCVDGMARLPHNYIDLVFADPPYNLGVNYNNGLFSLDKHRSYIAWCKRWFEAVYRVLKEGGSFYVMQYPEVCAQWIEPLSALFQLQRWITWHYPIMVGQSPFNWTRSHRAILFLTKGDRPVYFDGLADPQPYRNPTDKRIQKRMEKSPGATPYDVWEFNIVKNISKDKTSWPNQIPVKLIERIIKVSCPEGGLVCDPFMGSGSTAEAAVINRRKWIGFDVSPESKTITENRCGELQLRI